MSTLFLHAYLGEESFDSKLYRLNTKHNVYPVVNLKSTTMITGGNGTSGSPYVIKIG